MGNMQHTGFGASVPAARIDDLVITESADEVLVYDKQRHEIHHLNQASAAVWRLCDGKRSVAELARDANVDVEITQVAVNKLAEANLLEGKLAASQMLSGQTRRKLLKRAAMAGAGATIVSITAPTAAFASTPPRFLCSQCTTATVNVGQSLTCFCGATDTVAAGVCTRVAGTITVSGCV